MGKSVAIGLTNLHYAILTTDRAPKTNSNSDPGEIAYEEPIRLSGAITANFSPNASNDTLFADDGPYDTASTLGAMSLELNVADIPPEHRARLLGATYDSTTGMVKDSASDIPPYVAVGCAVVSILFCACMKLWGDNMKKHVKNQYVRILIGSVTVIALTFLTGSQIYNGSSASLLNMAIEYGQAHPYDFLLKIVFTAITLQSGFKGGAVFPALVIGATFGCTFGWWLGLPVEFAAAIGMVAVFCGSVNCPIASIFLSVEVFGGIGIVLFAIACAISFVFSGYFTVFPGQQFVYSKLRIEYKHSTMRNVEDDDLDGDPYR